ncbi:MAG: hypothetical protein Q9218_004612 [Villophora microphyllina]
MATISTILSALPLHVHSAFDSWPPLPSVRVMPVTDGRYEEPRPMTLALVITDINHKKGPKGSRAKVISELRLREGQKKAEHRRQDSTNNYASPASSPSSPILSGLLTQELIDGCLDFYFAHMYPSMPIMHNEQLWRLVADMDISVEAYCLIASFCAFMLIQPGIEAKAPQAIRSLTASPSRTLLGKTLLDEALRRRRNYEYIENPSVNAVITSFFLFGCCFGLDKHNTAWFHLREATTLAQILGMQDEKTYASAHLQKQLSQALPPVLESTETQAADLRTSQHWLRTIVWQLSITNGYLSSSSPDSSMTFGYPIEIAKDLVAVTSQLSRQSMEVHGIGLIEKLFDVACTLIDVLSCVPLDAHSTHLTSIGPLDYLNHLIQLISTLRNGASRYLPLLITKIRDTLPPHMAASITQPMVPIKVERQSPEGTPLPFALLQQDSSTSENQSSATSSPYSTPPFLHYYPPS